MDVIIGFGLFLASLLVTIIFSLDALYAVTFGMLCFSGIALYRGFKLKEVATMIWFGMKKSFVVIRVLLFIGVLTGLWRASGTIPFFVYYGIQAINPNFFILFAFLLSTAVSYTIGTSFGTASTIGVVMVVLAKAGGVNLAAVGGAVLSGCYFGDRSSPASSCANLVAGVTDTKLYDNVKGMMKRVIGPMIVTIGVYTVLSFMHPLASVGSSVPDEIAATYNLHWSALLPALIILILPLFKVEVRMAIAISSITAAFVAYFAQGMDVLTILKSAILGYTSTGIGQFAQIIGGGGLFSMVSGCVLVMISSTFSGIFAATRMLSSVEDFLSKLVDKVGVFTATFLTGIGTNIIACNQTLSIIITEQLIGPVYNKRGLSRTELAMNISNTTVMIAGLVPWNIACAMPIAMLGVDNSIIPYAVLLYAIPLWHFAKEKLTAKKQK